ncbi:uncharacterized protein EV154DRAFT_559234 [Mucor mucedo]|uniref:uncharacterized protein n=1 Tax=Mucor mucedo TaxID=29922 RepID=UPI0022203034|nr:uncharacterized protein EV154DRAFT_559234 [Mucor mucedo]KAI7895469.1 hypothetical protein EV154DRAFT_559234 [Mucor mucedo]
MRPPRRTSQRNTEYLNYLNTLASDRDSQSFYRRVYPEQQVDNDLVEYDTPFDETEVIEAWLVYYSDIPPLTATESSNKDTCIIEDTISSLSLGESSTIIPPPLSTSDISPPLSASDISPLHLAKVNIPSSSSFTASDKFPPRPITMTTTTSSQEHSTSPPITSTETLPLHVSTERTPVETTMELVDISCDAGDTISQAKKIYYDNILTKLSSEPVVHKDKFTCIIYSDPLDIPDSYTVITDKKAQDYLSPPPLQPTSSHDEIIRYTIKEFKSLNKTPTHELGVLAGKLITAYNIGVPKSEAALPRIFLPTRQPKNPENGQRGFLNDVIPYTNSKLQTSCMRCRNLKDE